MLKIFFILPFFIQALTIGIDEAYFHYKRGLPRWERIGHPIDTFSFFACFLFVLYAAFTPTNLMIFIAMSVFSCLLITKDEFVHKEHCSGAENWVHALLFILHPIVLFLICCLWPLLKDTQGPNVFSMPPDDAYFLGQFLWIQTGFVFIFFLYQVIFWNFVWKKAPILKP